MASTVSSHCGHRNPSTIVGEAAICGISICQPILVAAHAMHDAAIYACLLYELHRAVLHKIGAIVSWSNSSCERAPSTTKPVNVCLFTGKCNTVAQPMRSISSVPNLLARSSFFTCKQSLCMKPRGRRLYAHLAWGDEIRCCRKTAYVHPAALVLGAEFRVSRLTRSRPITWSWIRRAAAVEQREESVRLCNAELRCGETSDI